MGISSSKEFGDEVLDRKSRADATASLTEDEGSLHVLESSGKKKLKRSSATPRKSGSRAQLNAENEASPEKAPTTTLSTHIPDDQIQVNLAMADLMAYLQVVATNSQNLPTTRRDNPELRKAEHTLTADEYARKSAAFIPADVRVIAGSFNKYGRVWDLPTSMVSLADSESACFCSTDFTDNHNVSLIFCRNTRLAMERKNPVGHMVAHAAMQC